MRLPLRVFVAMLLVAALAAPSVASAQGWGARFGINVANVHGFEADSRTGLVAGVFGPAMTISTLEWQTDVLFSQEGAKDPDSDVKLRLNYIRVPIRAGFTVSGASATRVRVLVGPSLAFLLKSELSDGSSTESVTDDYKRYDIGLAAGVQVAVNRLVVDVGYTWGLVNIWKANDSEDGKNRALTATVGFRFGQ